MNGYKHVRFQSTYSLRSIPLDFSISFSELSRQDAKIQLESFDNLIDVIDSIDKK